MTHEECVHIARGLRMGRTDAIVEAFVNLPTDPVLAAQRGAECCVKAVAIVLATRIPGFDRREFMLSCGMTVR